MYCFTSTVPEWFDSKVQQRRQLHRDQCEKKPANPKFIEEADFTYFIVIDELKLVFCWIPKISCTTWKRVLFQAKNNGTIVLMRAHDDGNNWGHLGRLRNHPPAERKRILDTYYKAMFVREPFARVLSAFKNKVEGHSNDMFKSWEPSMPDEDVEKNKFPIYIRNVLSYNRSSLAINKHWRLYDQICPCEVDYDFIGHFEHLGLEGQMLLKAIGVDHLMSFPEYHPSHSKPYLLEYYSKLTKEEIYKLGKFYELDFKIFGYDFPGPLKEILKEKELQ